MFFICGQVGGGRPGTRVETVAGTLETAGLAFPAGCRELRIEERGGWIDAAGSFASASAGGVTLLLGGETRPDGAARCLDDYLNGNALDTAAFAAHRLTLVFDRRDQRLTLATDRFASIPMYYAVAGGALYFSTRINALTHAAGRVREVEPQAVYDYVFFHCVPSPRTIWRGVAKMQPAERACFASGRLSLDQYWAPRFVDAADDPAALAGELRETLYRAVGATADGPATGAFLSGGLDSSTVAGMLQRVTAGAARTFTIGFGVDAYDESGFARTAAEHFGTEHHQYTVSPADVAEAVDRIAAHCDEPFGNSSAVPTYCCARLARAAGIDVLLAGDGGDELFAGNVRYAEQAVFEFYAHLPAAVRSMLETGYERLPFLTRLPISGKGHRYILQAKMGLPDRLQSYNFLHRFDPALVFEPDFLAAVDTEAPWQALRARYAEPADTGDLNRMLYLDWKFTLADNDLVKVNQMCTLAGVGVRYPMLAPGLVDFSLKIPQERKLTGRNLRAFYKDAMRDFLPREVIGKSKHGFGLPFGVWLRDEPVLRDLAARTLERFKQRGIVRPGFIDEACRMHGAAAPGYYGELVWIMMTLELWLEASASPPVRRNPSAQRPGAGC